MPNNSEPINCVFTNENDLYRVYMPFLTNGGLFIPSKPGVASKMSIGEEISLSLTIPREPKAFSLKAKVVWITPVGVKGNKPPGYGVMFLGDEAKLLRSKIDKCLGSLITSGQSTDTI